jgi:RHS repeat-associated protein
VNLQTGDYAYTVTVEAVGAAGVSAQTTGTVVIVNRKASPYGPGWWLEGVERLLVSNVDTTRRVWIGGDGSTRRFKHVSGGVYVAEDTLAHSERLLRSGTGTGERWTREIRGGAVVVFDNLRRHIRTINRQRDTTTFEYVGSSAERVQGVRLPVAASDTLRVVLNYGGTNNLLTSVLTPWSVSQTRTTHVRRTDAQRITAVVEPAGDSIMYNYAGASLTPMERLDRLGKSVRWEYGVAGRVSRIAAALALNDTVVTRLCPAESRALVACAADGSAARAVAASRYRTTLDGPRPDWDARDVAQFYVGRYGAIDSIVDPYGARTRLFRENPQSPALVTRVVDPAGVTSETQYANGRPIRRIVQNQWFAGSRDTTLVTWDTTWSVVTEQRSPTGQITRQGVEASTGNVLWQARDTGDSTKVHMTYDSRNRPIQVFTVKVPSGETTILETYSYSGLFGNLTTTVTVSGQRTLAWLNYAGAVDSLESTLIGSGACHATTNPCMRQYFVRDGAGRVIRDSTVAPSVAWSVNPEATAQLTGTTPVMIGRVLTTYDPEGRALTVMRTTPGADYVGATATSTFAFDALGRPVASSIGGIFDSTTYDKGGNPIRLRTRSGRVITQTFDAVGRLTSRTTPEVRYPQVICTWCSEGQLPYTVRVPYYATAVGPNATSSDVVIPSETSVFSYDAAGRMVQADNPMARVRRGYYPNGALRADTTEMRSYYVPSGSGFSGVHRTVLNYTYTRDGQRSSRADSWGGGQQYGYDALGQLAWTQDSATASQAGHRVNFAYDQFGQMVQQSIAGTSFVDAWQYDNRGLPVARTGNMIETAQFDSRGKRTRVDGRLQFQSGPQIVMTAAYDGFGHLVATGTTGDAINTTDEFRTDAFGNAIRRFGNRGQALTVPETATQFNFNGSRMIGSTGLPYPTPADSLRVGANGGPPVQQKTELSLQYDAAGNVRYQQELRYQWTAVGGNSSGDFLLSTTGHQFSWTFYDANDRVRYVQRHTVEGAGPSSPTTFHEYWYDALGRRLLVRDRADSTSCGTPPYSETTPIRCQQAIARFTWDGDQIVREGRGLGGWHVAPNALESASGPSPWYGTRRYTHAGTIDAPVILWLDDANPRGIVRNWRGSAAGGLVLATNAVDTYVYPAARFDVQFAPDGGLSPLTPTAWLGTLIDEQKDASGLLYRRNRYYDPATGRFTQPDPIGLAGGLNLYGYAGGDPVNFSDPFGLTPACLIAPQVCVAGLVTAARATLAVATLALGAYQGYQNAKRASEETDAVVEGLEAGGSARTTSRGTRIVDRTGQGTSAEGALRDAAEALGENLEPSADGKTQVLRLPDGGTAASRPTSSGGEPTIQVNRPGVRPTKIRFDNP